MTTPNAQVDFKTEQPVIPQEQGFFMVTFKPETPLNRLHDLVEETEEGQGIVGQVSSEVGLAINNRDDGNIDVAYQLFPEDVTRQNIIAFIKRADAHPYVLEVSDGNYANPTILLKKNSQDFVQELRV